MRQGLDWVRGRREAHTALSMAECLEAQVERKKSERNSCFCWKNIGKLFKTSFYSGQKWHPGGSLGCWNRDLSPWATLPRAGLIAPALAWGWCIARPLPWHFSSAAQRLGSCKAVSVEMDSPPFVTLIHFLFKVISSYIQRSITASPFQSPVKSFLQVLHEVRMISRPCAAQSQSWNCLWKCVNHVPLSQGTLSFVLITMNQCVENWKLPQYCKYSSSGERWMISYQLLGENVQLT